jgi:hypothetical protein
LLATPVEGATRSLVLVHRDDGSFLSIAFFDDDEAARGDAETDPTARPSAVDVYAVANDRLRPERQARCARVSTHEGHPMRDVSPSPLVGLEGLAGLTMLIDRRSGKGLGILLFESEAALEQGHEFVSAASPGTAGQTSAVEFYDVAFLSS